LALSRGNAVTVTSINNIKPSSAFFFICFLLSKILYG
jgi:hypothetical protein